jgi:chromosome segregation ATPase
MLDEFDLAKQNNEASERALKAKFTAFDVKKEEFQIIQQEYDEATKLQEIEKQIDELRDQLSWAIVKEKEETIKKFENKCRDEEATKMAFIEKNKTQFTTFEEFEQKTAELTEKLNQATKKLTEASDETTDISKKISTLEKQKSSMVVSL